MQKNAKTEAKKKNDSKKPDSINVCVYGIFTYILVFNLMVNSWENMVKNPMGVMGASFEPRLWSCLG